MIAYKVVRRNPLTNEISSCIVRFNLQEMYKPKVKAVARVGGFLCFKEIDTARLFVDKIARSKRYNICYLEIWKVEVEQEVPLPKNRVSSLGVCPPSAYIRLWEHKSLLDYLEYKPWPEGTIAYKHITLIETVS